LTTEREVEGSNPGTVQPKRIKWSKNMAVKISDDVPPLLPRTTNKNVHDFVSDLLSKN
jgi:hypothetical protein